MSVRTYMIPEWEMKFQSTRSGGKGGQNVNKVNSKVILHWRVADTVALPKDVRDRFILRYANRINIEGDVVIMSDEHRDNPRNKGQCIEKLMDMIDSVWEAPKKRKKTKPSYSSSQKRLDSKKIRSDHKKGRGKPDY